MPRLQDKRAARVKFTPRRCSASCEVTNEKFSSWLLGGAALWVSRTQAAFPCELVQVRGRPALKRRAVGRDGRRAILPPREVRVARVADFSWKTLLQRRTP